MSHYNRNQLVLPFTLLRKTQVSDGRGGQHTTETDMGTHLAFMRMLRGEEREVNSGLSGTVEVRMVVYAAIGIRASDVIVYNGLRYNVRAAYPPGISEFQELDAESGVVS